MEGCGQSPIPDVCGVGARVHGEGDAVDGSAAASSAMVENNMVRNIQAIKVLVKYDF